MRENKINDSHSAEIALFDSSESLLFKGPFMELPLKDSLTRHLCIKYFSDPDPSFMHRSAAACRILGEVEDKLRHYSDGKDMTIPIEYLSSEFREILSGGSDVSVIQLFWPAAPEIT